ncbi:hypothetical protein SAMN05660330_02695 [Desulforhopalus singaporensis]|uniref:Uncharacterized protein n=1 Tax=Desulforhopalus singaporensis TaxID=91360 RepID=A0A1H0SKC4_9BACT|nr:hypothetical protein SAMN05660330_02695 [Desulforhopalus singaporensis]
MVLQIVLASGLLKIKSVFWDLTMDSENYSPESIAVFNLPVLSCSIDKTEQFRCNQIYQHKIFTPTDYLSS